MPAKGDGSCSRRLFAPDLQERAKGCQTPEEILELAREEGIELSDEDLEHVAGGWGASDSGCGVKCPECGSYNMTGDSVRAGDSNWEEFTCQYCGNNWMQEF